MSARWRSSRFAGTILSATSFSTRSNSLDSASARAAAPAATARASLTCSLRAPARSSAWRRSAAVAFARLFEARGRRRRIEPEKQRARLDRLALAHGHFEDGLLVLGNELDAVALERAEERIAAVRARAERERVRRDGHPNWSNHAKSPARVPRFPRRRRVRR